MYRERVESSTAILIGIGILGTAIPAYLFIDYLNSPLDQIPKSAFSETSPPSFQPEPEHSEFCKRVNAKFPTAGHVWRELGSPESVIFKDRSRNGQIIETLIHVNGKMGRLPRLVHRGDEFCVSRKGSFLPNPAKHKSVPVRGSYGGVFMRN